MKSEGAIKELNISALLADASGLLSRAFQIEPVVCSFEFDRAREEEPFLGGVIRTDLAQRIAERTRVAEQEVAGKALEAISAAAGREGVSWIASDRFLNLVPASGRGDVANSRTVLIATQSYPQRVFAIKPPSNAAGARRLYARLLVQRMALELSGRDAAFMCVTPGELRSLALSQSGPKDAVSTVWIYPQSAPKDLLSESLRALGVSHEGRSERALVQSITSDEWGEVDFLPAVRELTLGQLLALAEFNLYGDVDLPGASRAEVQNLPWLMRTLVERLDRIFSSTASLDSSVQRSRDEPREAPLFGGVMQALSLERIALQGAARGGVVPYLAFWRTVTEAVLRIINDPTVRQRVARGEVSPIDISCSEAIRSVLSETVTSWEKHLQDDRILSELTLQ